MRVMMNTSYKLALAGASVNNLRNIRFADINRFTGFPQAPSGTFQFMRNNFVSMRRNGQLTQTNINGIPSQNGRILNDGSINRTFNAQNRNRAWAR